METLKATSPHHVRQKLIKHKPAYIESVGKADLTTLSQVVDSPGGKGTVLRLIMGATERMPVRALGYIDSALRVAQILPVEQVQIVHANNLGCSVNGLRPEVVHRQSMMLAVMTSLLIDGLHKEVSEKVLHAEDTPFDLETFLPMAQTALDADRELSDALSKKGAKHNGEYVTYTSAHFAFQDTDQLKLRPLLPGAITLEQVSADRIVSVGCKQERPFYLARMAMRKLSGDIETVETAQIFTHHVSPPYFMARDGEMSLEDALREGFDIGKITDTAARRDTEHLISVINRERS